MPTMIRGGGGISRKSDGEIFEDSIPAGITCETISVLYNAMWVENVKVFNGETSNSIYKGEVLLSDKKSTVSQYSTSRQVRFTKKACSFKTDISIADIREFIVKLGTFVYDISFGKNYYGLTRKVYVQLFDKNENRVDFFDDGSSASCHLLLDIQNGVIKEIAFGTGSSMDHKDAKTKYAFSVKVNTVSRSIIDATAVPDDVKINKFFYNNQGRQVGTFDLPFPNLKVYNLRFDANKDYALGNVITYTTTSNSMQITGDTSQDLIGMDYLSQIKARKIIELPHTRLVGVKYGNRYLLSSEQSGRQTKYIRYIPKIATYKSESDAAYGRGFDLLFHNNSIYVGLSAADMTHFDKAISFSKAVNFQIYYE